MATTIPPEGSPTVIVVRVGPTPLRPSRTKPRHDELARIFARTVTIEEAATVEALAEALATMEVAAVAVDAAPPGQLHDVVRLAGDLPVLQPRWHRRRSAQGEHIERFEGYGQLIAGEAVALADGVLAPPPR
jgi:hypothetical protein